MKYDELMSKLFGFSIPTYYNWKKENRPIINFVNSFSDEQINEFLELGKFLNSPRTLLDEYKNQTMKFVDIIINVVTWIDNGPMDKIDEQIDDFLNVLVYTITHSEFSYEYKTKNIKQDMQRYYDEYRNLYNINSWDLVAYTLQIDEVNIDEVDFSDLINNDFEQLVFYSTTYNIKHFNIILKFYLKYIYFNNIDKELKIIEIYEQTKAHYKNKKTGELFTHIHFNADKLNNYTLVFDYDLFKKLVKNTHCVL